MTDCNPSNPARKARRKAAAQRRKGLKQSARRSARVDLDLGFLNAIGDQATDLSLAVVAPHLGLHFHELPISCVLVDDLSAGVIAVPAATSCTVLIPFAPQVLLRLHGMDSRVVAGAAIWSVGPGDLDALDHGMSQSFGSKGDAACANYHTWLDIGGHLFDFGARFLPAKFEATHSTRPCTTPRAQWRRFPKTIVHPAGKPMGNPVTNRRAAYGYAEGPPCLLREVRLHLGPILRDLDEALG
jgi:hypothetical protein